MNRLATSRVKGVKVRASSFSAIERLAMRCRRTLAKNRDVTVELNGESLFESLDVYVVDGTKLSYGVSESEEIGGAEALTFFEPIAKEIRIVLSARTHRQLAQGYARPLFTLCHEIGHAVMHSSILKSAHTLPHGLARGGQHKSYEDSEWQADAFAAALIAPAAGIERLRLTEPSQISRAFGLSDEASDVRLRIFQQRRAELLGGGR